MSGSRAVPAVRAGVDRLRARPALGLLGAIVTVELWSLRHLLDVVTWPNDLSFHLAMASWAEGRFRAGQIPTDGWFPRLSGGLPQFHLYQSLPHVLTGALGVPLGSERAAHLALWLLVGTWPVAVFIGARALGLTDRAAVVAAAVALLVRSPTGYGFEPFSYLWIGNGLWSQAWGMWTAPLALGWSARAVRTGRGFGRAVLAVALTVAFHLPTAWFVLVAIGLLVVIHPAEWRQRIPRSLGIGVLSVAASAWVLVPFIVDRWASNDSSFNDQDHFHDSFGWRRVMGWMFAGDIIDARRLPVLSALAAVGLVVGLARWRRGGRTGDREVVALAGFSLLLFVGTHPFGPVIDRLPGSSQVFLHRYVATLQLGLVLLVGLGADELAERGVRWWAGRAPVRVRWARAPLAIVAIGLALAPAVRSTHALVAEDRSWVAFQQRADRGIGADATELVAIAAARGPGRIYAGKLNGYGDSFKIGGAAAPIWLSHLPVDSLGFNLRVSAPAADIETYIDESTAADLDALGVRYVLVPRGQQPPRGAWFLAARGDVQLWEVPGDGLVSAVAVTGPPEEVGTDEIVARLLPIMRAQGGSPTAVRLLDLAGRSPAIPVQTTELDERPGSLDRTEIDLEAGAVRTRARFARPGAVLVKANWHPRWTATVDGKAVPVAAVAPTWLAIPVGPGTHQVELHYHPWAWTPWLLLLAIGAVGVGGWWSRRSATGAGRPVRSRVRGIGRLLAASMVLAGCGSPHHLSVVRDPGPEPGSPLSRIDLVRPDSYATLDRVLAPDRRTVLVVTGPRCTTCADLATSLLASAVGAHPYSLIVLGTPTLAPEVLATASAQGASTWTVRAGTVSLRRTLDLPGSSGVAVVDPDGSVVGAWDPSAGAAPVIAIAQREG